MAISLDDLARPVSSELELFFREYTELYHSDVEIIEEIGAYILAQKSKHIRPLLLLLSAKVCGEPTRETIISASLVELLHTATLIHDDIIDEATVRRGAPSVNVVWQNKISVLMGDFMFSRSLSNMLRLRNFEALEILSRTSEAMSSGEMLQLAKSVNNGMDEDSYFKLIWLKTASFFASCCKVGGLTAGGTKEQNEALWTFGKNLGLAFQIKDDLFDYTMQELHIGKPVGRDLMSNLVTLPLLFVLNNMSNAEGHKIRESIRNGLDSDDINRINDMIISGGGVQYAESKLDEISRLAINALDIFPDSDAKRSLVGFIEFNRQRSR